MGTPQFAVPALEELAKATRIVEVVTQPDRRGGRGRRITVPPVKEAAIRLGIPTWQPRSLRTSEAVDHLRDLDPVVVVVAAFGHILRPEVLAIPARGFVNIHASLLPRYRGAEPVAAAILAGDEQTGVTIMQIDEGTDTGPILAQRTTPVLPDDTRSTLTARLACLGAGLLMEVLPSWIEGDTVARAQNEGDASYAPRLKKEQGELDWHQPAIHLERKVRAYSPWPGTFTVWQGRRLKVIRAQARGGQSGTAGDVAETAEGDIVVITGCGELLLQEIQLAGKRPMRGVDFARGQREFIGAHLPS
jgi:methionyl-tRNA formyltransferase